MIFDRIIYIYRRDKKNGQFIIFDEINNLKEEYSDHLVAGSMPRRL